MRDPGLADTEGATVPLFLPLSSSYILFNVHHSHSIVYGVLSVLAVLAVQCINYCCSLISKTIFLHLLLSTPAAHSTDRFLDVSSVTIDYVYETQLNYETTKPTNQPLLSCHSSQPTPPRRQRHQGSSLPRSSLHLRQRSRGNGARGRSASLNTGLRFSTGQSSDRLKVRH